MGVEASPEVVERSGVEAFILKVTIPLLLDAQPHPAILGTGCLFKIDNRAFVVTAAHCLLEDEYDPGSAMIPLDGIAFPSRLRDATLQTFGEMNVWRPRPPSHVDVAILELKSPETIQLLEDNWGFLALEQVGRPSPGDQFIVAGFPFEGVRLDGDTIKQAFFSLMTDRLRYTPQVNHPDPILDLFFHLEEEGELVSGGRREIPSLRGMSGSSIWAYTPAAEASGALWSPATALKVYAVQSSAKRGQWFRGVNWAAVIRILKDPALGLTHPLLK